MSIKACVDCVFYVENGHQEYGKCSHSSALKVDFAPKHDPVTGRLKGGAFSDRYYFCSTMRVQPDASHCGPDGRFWASKHKPAAPPPDKEPKTFVEKYFAWCRLHGS